ncbi:ZIP family metal transporter [Cohnella terricola]|uniref:ZIP family metal transporter n=2 Tax=Cohnella terricola TaxID=1289167 RepID=A0A559JU11_9BACL|nr:ZIP family metal transporter [Cohnella terricola]
MTPQAGKSSGKAWLWGILPVALLIAIVAVILTVGTGVKEESPIPIENVEFERVYVNENGIVLNLLNASPQAVDIVMARVADAYWDFTIKPDGAIPRMGRATVTIPYPWVEGDGYEVRLVTGESTVFSTEIGAAIQAPAPDAQRFMQYALIGFYVGVVPVALGLLWFPLMRRFTARGIHAVLAFTIGLLLFLVVDTFQEGFELAEQAPESLKGSGLVWFGAILSMLFLIAIDQMNERKKGKEGSRGERISFMLASGIGLHNFGEGLAIGAAFAVGEAALGTFLIIGFTLHNMTEGIGVAAPLAQRQRPKLRTFVWLALIAGGPAILGTWVGGFVMNNTLASLYFGIGAGAIIQVVFVIGRMLWKESVKLGYAPVSWTNYAGVAAGIALMYGTSLLVSG